MSRLAYTCLRTAASKALSLKKETGAGGGVGLAGGGVGEATLAGSGLAAGAGGGGAVCCAGLTAGIGAEAGAEGAVFVGAGVTGADRAGLTSCAKSALADRRMNNGK